MKLKSPVDRCGTEFGGGNGWDGWTGHVGKHLETTAKVRVNKMEPMGIGFVEIMV
jgi:hypothetical protein